MTIACNDLLNNNIIIIDWTSKLAELLLMYGQSENSSLEHTSV